MISAAELATLMKSDTPHAVLDLRERGAYQKRHIFRATSLPRRLLEVRLPALVPARPTAIVVSDDTGALSALALPTLRAMGYRNILPLGGGLDGWIGEGRPTAQGVNTPSKVFGERVLHDLHTPEVTCRELDRRMAVDGGLSAVGGGARRRRQEPPRPSGRRVTGAGHPRSDGSCGRYGQRRSRRPDSMD